MAVRQTIVAVPHPEGQSDAVSLMVKKQSTMKQPRRA
jgi:hypothetical protein